MKYHPVLLITLLCGAVFSQADEPTKSAVPVLPAFLKMQALAGSWVGTMSEDGKSKEVSARFQLISDKSALAGWLGEGTPYEMVTMFHPDGSDLIATHYCSAHNQPRMVLVPGTDPNRLVFKFRDGTNIAPGDGHMQQVTFILDGPDHHIEEWVYLDHGKEMEPGRFDFHRKS